MMKAAGLFIFITSVSAGNLFAGPYDVIYGEDNRVEVYDAPLSYQRLARSAATLVPISEIYEEPDTGFVTLGQRTLKEFMAEAGIEKNVPYTPLNGPLVKVLCEDEKFVNQPNPGACSGFLVAPDLVATAGHCANIPNVCRNYSWVFDFKVDHDTLTAGVNIPVSNVYNCKEIVSKALSLSLGLDYGIIKLDRPVTDRFPLDYRSKKIIQDYAPLIVIGSPSGLPLKVAGGANVRENIHPNFFVANIDSYQGNSGSAVFNSDTGIVEGILVRGENDFVVNSQKKCIESNRCKDEGCRGEEVSRMTSIPEIALKTILDSAAISGDVSVLNSLSKHKFWIDFYGKDGLSALHKAASVPKLESIKFLIDKKADTSLKDVSGNTALHFLALTNTSETLSSMETLIKANAPVNETNNAGDTALLISARKEFVNSTIKLVRLGADATVSDGQSNTALHYFSRMEGPNVLSAIKVLIDAGAPVNKVNDDGNTALLIAVKKFLPGLISLLMNNGADASITDSEGNTALHLIVRENRPGSDIALFSISKDKSALNKKNSYGDTALLIAVKNFNINSILQLARSGADASIKDQNGNSALHILSTHQKIDTLIAVSALINAKAPLNQLNQDGDTPLLIATKNFLDQLVILFASNGADSSIKDKNGNTALHILARVKRPEMMKAVDALIKSGAPLEAKDSEGLTPLILAAKTLNSDLVLRLYTAGANINATDASGETALFYAAKANDINFVNTLLASGIRVELKNSAGKNAYEMIKKSNFKAVKKVLRKAIRKQKRKDRRAAMDAWLEARKASLEQEKEE